MSLHRGPSARWLAAGLMIAVGSASARSQFVIDGTSAQAALGSALANIGDVDGDGFPDLSLGAPDSDAGGDDSGAVWVVSGATGALLYSVPGAGPFDDFGYSLAGVGDADGDRVPDVLVGAPQMRDDLGWKNGSSRYGYAQLLSGVDGTAIRLHQGGSLVEEYGQLFGAAVAGAGDVDGDGAADLLVGERFGDLEGYIWLGPGRVHVLSGADGHLIREIVGSMDGAELVGAGIAPAGDVDEDGVPDIFIGAPSTNPAGGTGTPGAVLLASGATGATLWISYGVDTFEKLGLRLAAAGDVDGDGATDVLASGRQVVRLYSGADGAFIRSIATSDLTDEDGARLASAGDVNLDGFDDVAIGDPLANATGAGASGSVRIFSGKEGLALGMMLGTQLGERFGGGLATLPALPGSEGPALAIGSPGYDGPAGVDAGRVQVVPVSGLAQVPYVLTMPGTQMQTGFALAVAIPGDVDNDGWDDVAVGAPYDSTVAELAGAVRVYSGRDGSLLLDLHGTAAFQRFGFAVGRVGDLDRDGHDDLVVGAPFKVSPLGPGKVRVHSGRDGSLLLELNGLSNNDQFGYAVGGAGDIDHDGTPDVLVGSPGDDTAGGNFGAARIFSGATGLQLVQAVGNASGAEFGAAVAPLGDVNADGTPDIAVGARSHNGPAGTSAGRAVIASGATGAILRQVVGSSAFALLGSGVSSAGDLDGDGVADMLVGEPGADTGGAQSGRLLVVSGQDGSILLDVAGLPEQGLGRSVDRLGDVTGDGRDELVATSPNGTGLAEIIDGTTGQWTFFAAGAPGDLLGMSLAAGGDVDNDGRPDFVVGSSKAGSFGAPEGAAIVINPTPADTPWQSAGAKLPGTFGAPVLKGSGSLLPATSTTLALSHAKPGAFTALVVGFVALNAPFKGGTMVPYPHLVIQGLPIGPAGTLNLTAPWPGGLPPGTSLWFQHWFADAAALQGLAASNAVKAITP